MSDKKWFCTIPEEVYVTIPLDTRMRFHSAKVVYDDHELYKDDPAYKQLYSDKKKATTALDDYKYDKRHGKQ
jgi:hypothetical protein